jgi:hypothetical protein
MTAGNSVARSNEEILALINECESTFAVHQWRHRGVHLWPLIRYQIATENHRLAKLSPATQNAESAGYLRQKLAPLAPLLSMGQGLARYTRAVTLEDRAHNDSIVRPATALLYSDGASLTMLGDRWYDRFCDPLHAALARRQLTALTWQPLHTYHTPRHTRSAFIQPLLDTVTIAARVEKAALARLRSSGSRTLSLDEPSATDGVSSPEKASAQLAQALAWLAARAPEFRLWTPSQYMGLAQYAARFADAYTPWLKRVAPRVAFKTCYYGVEAMGFVLACRRLGVSIVDLQHGVAGAQHFAYGGWKRVPDGGYNVLPTHFWCWSDADRAAILQWNGPAYGHHPLVGGNPFLSAWVRGDKDLVATAQSSIDTVLNRTRGLKQVLWTAHGFEEQATLEALAALVHQTRDQVHWWIRMHPVRAGRKKDFARALQATGGRYTLDEASDLAVYAILRVVDVHVTEVSSTTLEAAAFGVPTVLVCPSEVGLFAELVASGWAAVVSSIGEIHQAIDRQIAALPTLKRAPLPSSVPQGEGAMEHALTELGLTQP